MKMKKRQIILTAGICMALHAGSLQAAEQSAESVMSPWTNTNMLGTVTEETAIPDLKDDFYQAVNHDWLSKAQLKPGYIGANTFQECQDQVDEMMMEVMTDPSVTGHDAELFQTLYSLFLDWDSRNELGVTPFEPHMHCIEEIESLEDLTDHLTSEEGIIYGFPFSTIGITMDRENAKKYGIEIYHADLFLNDSAEYESRTPSGELYYSLHQQMGSLALSLFGYSEEEAQEILDHALELDGLLAPSIMTTEENYAADVIEKTTHPVTYEDLLVLSPNYPLGQIMEAMNDTDWDSINLYEPEWLERLNEIYTEENLQLFKDWMLLRYAESCLYMADEETYRAAQEIENAINGIEESLSDEKIAYQFAAGELTTSVSKVFADQFMTEEIRQDVTQIIEEIIAQYRVMLAEETWLSEETREKAISKLDHMIIHAAYPDKWEDTEILQITPKEEGGNLLVAKYELAKYSLEKAQTYKNTEMDPEIWTTPLDEVNAFYTPQENSINIVGGILREPFYSPDMSEEEKMGGIGMVIGHEISHAFDTIGAQYDEMGNLANWWTEEDLTQFSERAQKLINYYDSMIVMPDGYGYSGTLVQEEAIADMGGLRCLMNLAKQKEDFDYDAFFRANAGIWKSVSTQEGIYLSIVSNPHPLNYLRANATYQQVDEFFETYNITEGDGMYLAEEDRVCVW